MFSLLTQLGESAAQFRCLSNYLVNLSLVFQGHTLHDLFAQPGMLAGEPVPVLGVGDVEDVGGDELDDVLPRVRLGAVPVNDDEGAESVLVAECVEKSQFGGFDESWEVVLGGDVKYISTDVL